MVVITVSVRLNGNYCLNGVVFIANIQTTDIIPKRFHTRVDLQRMRVRVESNEELMSYFNPNNARDDVRSKFDEDVDSELLNFINTKLVLYNKLTEEAANAAFKRVWFNELYDHKVRGMI